MTDVKCRVKSCHYWGSGDVCVADSIMVDNNKTQAATGRMEAGSMAFEKGARKSPTTDFEAGDITGNIGRSMTGSGASLAGRSEETLCKTFRPKDSQTSH